MPYGYLDYQTEFNGPQTDSALRVKKPWPHKPKTDGRDCDAGSGKLGAAHIGRTLYKEETPTAMSTP